MEEYDLHVIKTKKNTEDIKGVLRSDVFGNYDVYSDKPRQYEFGLFFHQPCAGCILLRLDYAYHNYHTVSYSIMENLGRHIESSQYIVFGLKVYKIEAFLRHYKYNDKKMALVEEITREDGKDLTPIAVKKFDINTHEFWKVMQEKYNDEIMRQGIQYRDKSGVGLMADHWKRKYGSLDNIHIPVCDSMYFVARPEIEQLRKDANTPIEMKKEILGTTKK